MSEFRGKKFGALLVGPEIPKINWRYHPCYPKVPMSCRKGKLYECYCECGELALISDKTLSIGKITCCGKDCILLKPQYKLTKYQWDTIGPTWLKLHGYSDSSK